MYEVARFGYRLGGGILAGVCRHDPLFLQNPFVVSHTAILQPHALQALKLAVEVEQRHFYAVGEGAVDEGVVGSQINLGRRGNECGRKGAPGTVGVEGVVCGDEAQLELVLGHAAVGLGQGQCLLGRTVRQDEGHTAVGHILSVNGQGCTLQVAQGIKLEGIGTGGLRL